MSRISKHIQSIGISVRLSKCTAINRLRAQLGILSLLCVLEGSALVGVVRRL